jgi:hypothetical protein
MGTTSKILIAVMTFGIWRSGQDTRLMTKLEALNSVIAGSYGLQTAVQ